MTERKPPGVSFETWVDKQIRAVMERGEFDHLPGAGIVVPVDLDDVLGEWRPELPAGESVVHHGRPLVWRRSVTYGGAMPEPILVAIATALAGRGASSLYDLVRRRFTGRERATAALAAAAGSTPESAEVRTLAEELAAAERSDPEFATELRALWGAHSVQQHAAGDGVVNQVSGLVSGNVVQARDIQGGVSF